MSLYGESQVSSIDEMANDPRIMEMFLVEDLLHGDQEDIKNFLESEEAKILIEKQVLTKPTVTRLSKQDDLRKRTVLCAYMLAKEANSPSWKKLVKYQALKKEAKSDILKKFGAKARLLAVKSQKGYIKTARSAQKTANDKMADQMH